MPRLKVLFADDQIPDEDIPENDIASEMMKRYPSAASSFIDAFKPMRETVKTLRDGYDVTIANTKKKALNLINTTHFDIAIVDLRWDADKAVPQEQSDSTGWMICDAIEKANKTPASTPTFQIICSSRFDREPQIAMIAAQKSKLPVFKSYNKAGSLSLLASVNFIEKYISSPSNREVALEGVNRFRQTVQNLLNEALIQERRWANLTIALVTLSVILILAGALLALLGYVQAGTLTSVSSVITSAISILLFRELRRTQENTKNSLTVAEKNYKDAIKQLAETGANQKAAV